jgi:hypothetical protein
MASEVPYRDEVACASFSHGIRSFATGSILIGVPSRWQCGDGAGIGSAGQGFLERRLECLDLLNRRRSSSGPEGTEHIVAEHLSVPFAYELSGTISATGSSGRRKAGYSASVPSR